MSYASLDELKDHLEIELDEDADDTLLTLALSAASAMVDRYTKRRFTKDVELTSRVYSTYQREVVTTDDIADDDELEIRTDDGSNTFATVLDADDFTLEPVNASADGQPWTQIYSEAWPRRLRNGVKVTAHFGWAAVPDEVKQATLIQAARIFKRKDSPFGVAGSPEAGSELRLLARLDPDVEQLLAGLRRLILA
jgi:gp6-like head-tail connector protein